VKQAAAGRRDGRAGRQQVDGEVSHGGRAAERPGKRRQQVGKDRRRTPRVDAAAAGGTGEILTAAADVQRLRDNGTPSLSSECSH